MWHRITLDYKSCKCGKRIACSLVEECSKNIDENKMIYYENFSASLLNTLNKSYFDSVTDLSFLVHQFLLSFNHNSSHICKSDSINYMCEEILQYVISHLL